MGGENEATDRTQAAAFLRAVRGALSLSQTEFAQLVGVSRRTLWSAEEGGEESLRAVAEDTLRSMVVIAAEKGPAFIIPPVWARKRSKSKSSRRS
jgi:DNA-binding XRE family transcriptional regulator